LDLDAKRRTPMRRNEGLFLAVEYPTNRHAFDKIRFQTPLLGASTAELWEGSHVELASNYATIGAEFDN
jgi:hypothetical protein